MDILRQVETINHERARCFHALQKLVGQANRKQAELQRLDRDLQGLRAIQTGGVQVSTGSDGQEDVSPIVEALNDEPDKQHGNDGDGTEDEVVPELDQHDG